MGSAITMSLGRTRSAVNLASGWLFRDTGRCEKIKFAKQSQYSEVNEGHEFFAKPIRSQSLALKPILRRGNRCRFERSRAVDRALPPPPCAAAPVPC